MVKEVKVLLATLWTPAKGHSASVGGGARGRDSGRLVEVTVVMRTTMENVKGRRPNTGAVKRSFVPAADMA